MTRWALPLLATESAAGAADAALWWRVAVAVVLAALGVWMLVPRLGRPNRRFGAALALVGFAILMGTTAPLLQRSELVTQLDWGMQTVFYVLAGVTLTAAAATIAMRNPVYSALWFALSLLGVGGLMLVQGAQLIGLATVVVYAGAIVVTFLFVLMLAQPEGHAAYDRISWGRAPALVSSLGGMALVALLTITVVGLNDLPEPAHAMPMDAEQTLAGRQWHPAEGPRQEDHVAGLGAELFSRHLVAVEVAGTLLLAALVAAVAIVIAGRIPRGGLAGRRQP